MITLILGGNKSGKSAFALRLFEQAKGVGVFLATGRARDAAFAEQIARHRMERDPSIPVLETGPDLPSALMEGRRGYGKILVDSLDFWLFSCLDAGRNPQELIEVLEDWKGPDVFFVSCEIGLGPIAADSATRAFVRQLGALNQEVARIADEVHLVAAGLPVTLKKI